MDKNSIITDYKARVQSGAKLLQLQNCGWGEYVSCSVAKELVRQAIEEACFFMREQKRHAENLEKAEQHAVKERLTLLAVNDQLIIKHINWPYATPPAVLLCYLGKSTNRKYSSTDTGISFKITRIR